MFAPSLRVGLDPFLGVQVFGSHYNPKKKTVKNIWSPQLSHPKLLDMWKEWGVTCEDKHICWHVCHILEGFGCGAMERPHKVKGWETLGSHLRYDMKILAPQTNGDCLGVHLQHIFLLDQFSRFKISIVVLWNANGLNLLYPQHPLFRIKERSIFWSLHIFRWLGTPLGTKHSRKWLAFKPLHITRCCEWGWEIIIFNWQSSQHQETQNDQEIGPFFQVGIKSSLIEKFSTKLEISYEELHDKPSIKMIVEFGYHWKNYDLLKS